MGYGKTMLEIASGEQKCSAKHSCLVRRKPLVLYCRKFACVLFSRPSRLIWSTVISLHICGFHSSKD